MKGKKDYIIILLLFFVLMFIYFSNSRYIPPGDSIPTRLLPISIIYEKDFDLDEFITEDHWYTRKSKGHFLSKYPVGPALLVLPVYLIPVLMSIDVNSIVPLLEKLSSAIIVSLSALVLFLLLKQLTDIWISLLITIIFALATSNWSVASQNIWQHGPGELFILLSIYNLIKGAKENKYIPLSGFYIAVAYTMRPLHAIAVLVFGVYVALKYRKNKFLLFKYILLSALPISLVTIYNLYYFNNLFIGGYEFVFPVVFPVKPFMGLLFSPSRGLFTYSPVLLFCIPGVILAWRNKYDPLFHCFFIIMMSYLIIYASWHSWWGGWSYGPRLQTDAIPFLIMFLVPFFIYIKSNTSNISIRRFFYKKVQISLFIIAFLVSISTQLIGAFEYNNSWNAIADVDSFPERLFYWQDSQLYFYTKLLNPFDRNFRKGIIATRETNYTKGKRYLKEEIKKDNKNIIAHYILADILQSDGEYDDSKNHYMQILELYPNYRPALHRLFLLEKNSNLLNNIKNNSLVRNKWITSSNYNNYETYMAIDDQLNTRWTTRTPQHPGMYFLLSFEGAIEFSRILLYLGNSMRDCPRKLTIEIYDKENHKKKIYSSSEATCKNNYIDIHFNQKFIARKVKLLQNGKNMWEWWSIHEIYIQ